MKRTTLLCAAGLTLLLLAGCAKAEGQLGYVGAETAKQKALEAASLTASEVSFISTDMGTRNGLDYYQIRFQAGGQTYQYDVDALTGVVINAQGPDAGAAGQSDPPEATAPQMTDAVSTPTLSPGPEASQSPLPPATQAPVTQPPATAAPSAAGSDSRAYIGEAEAKRVALAHAGLTADQVSLIRAKLEFDDGRWMYDVEFFTPSGKEYDYEIDAYTGAVISYDYDAEYVYPQGGSGSGSITAEQARQIALARVPGATAADIREFETDYDDGALKYEGKIIYNGMEYEFEIDAYSGTVRDWSVEPFGW